jgi:hypothetical protein
MKVAKLIALTGLLAMTGILIYGFTSGDFFAEGAKLLTMPWGIVSLVDMHVIVLLIRKTDDIANFELAFIQTHFR